MDNEIDPPIRDLDKPFLMSVESTYNIKGRGAVATGTVEQGKIKIGEEVEIVGYNPINTKVSITGVETFNKTLDQGEAGDNVGLLIRGLTREQLRRGMIIAKPKTLTPNTKFEANIYCLKTEEGGRKTSFATGYRPQLFYKTADSAAEILLPESSKIAMPGDNVSVKFQLNYPLCLVDGSRFALREGGKTVAVGIVTKVLPKEEVLDFGKDQKKKEETPEGVTAPGTTTPTTPPPAGKTATTPPKPGQTSQTPPKPAAGQKTPPPPAGKTPPPPATGKPVPPKPAATGAKVPPPPAGKPVPPPAGKPVPPPAGKPVPPPAGKTVPPTGKPVPPPVGKPIPPAGKPVPPKPTDPKKK